MNKKYFLLILTMLILVINPKIALDGAVSGLTLWFNVILPTLLPFMIISYLIQNVYGSRIQNPFAYIIMIGLTCGFPMGAYSATSMYNQGKISRRAAYLLLMCCNISSPAFVISYIIMSSLKLTNTTFYILIINYIPILLVIIYVFLTEKQITANSPYKVEYYNTSLNFETLDDAINSSITNILKLGVYIIIFSLFAHFVAKINIENILLKCLIIGLFEITTGINYTVNSTLSLDQMIPTVLILNAFGSFSCMFQSMAFIKNTDLSIKKYMYSKILLALMTFATWYLLVHVLNFKIYY